MSAALALALTSASESGLRRRVGTVKTTSPLVVTMAAGDMPITSRLESYAPTVGHVVLVLVDDGGAAVIAGRLVYP